MMWENREREYYVSNWKQLWRETLILVERVGSRSENSRVTQHSGSSAELTNKDDSSRQTAMTGQI